jgi:hypothetical protein
MDRQAARPFRTSGALLDGHFSLTSGLPVAPAVRARVAAPAACRVFGRASGSARSLADRRPVAGARQVVIGHEGGAGAGGARDLCGTAGCAYAAARLSLTRRSCAGGRRRAHHRWIDPRNNRRRAGGGAASSGPRRSSIGAGSRFVSMYRLSLLDVARPTTGALSAVPGLPAVKPGSRTPAF